MKNVIITSRYISSLIVLMEKLLITLKYVSKPVMTQNHRTYEPSTLEGRKCSMHFQYLQVAYQNWDWKSNMMVFSIDWAQENST